MGRLPFPPKRPRVSGIWEHFERVQLYCSLAQQQSDTKHGFRLQLAAIYSCRAITELMLEAARKGEVRGYESPDQEANAKAFESAVVADLAYFELIKRIRLHDFHRFGIIPPDAAIAEVFLGGPVKLRAQRGGAAQLAVGSDGITASSSGEASVVPQRPLLSADGEFFDEASGGYARLEVILKAFLESARSAIAKFERLLK